MTVTDLPAEHRALAAQMLAAGFAFWYCADNTTWTAVTA